MWKLRFHICYDLKHQFSTFMEVLNGRCVLNTALNGHFAFWIRKKKHDQEIYTDNHIYSDKVHFSLLISRNIGFKKETDC